MHVHGSRWQPGAGGEHGAPARHMLPPPHQSSQPAQSWWSRESGILPGRAASQPRPAQARVHSEACRRPPGLAGGPKQHSLAAAVTTYCRCCCCCSSRARTPLRQPPPSAELNGETGRRTRCRVPGRPGWGCVRSPPSARPRLRPGARARAAVAAEQLLPAVKAAAVGAAAAAALPPLPPPPPPQGASCSCGGAADLRLAGMLWQRCMAYGWICNALSCARTWEEGGRAGARRGRQGRHGGQHGSSRTAKKHHSDKTQKSAPASGPAPPPSAHAFPKQQVPESADHPQPLQCTRLHLRMQRGGNRAW